MPKMKSHSGAKKRIKKTGSGKFVTKHSGTSHLLTGKKRRKQLHKDMTINGVKTKMLNKLLPYAGL